MRDAWRPSPLRAGSERGCDRYIPDMVLSAIRALKAALETGEFARAYLFHGDNEFLKEEKVRAVIERVTEAGTRDFNLEVRRGAELTAESLALALDSLPMLAAQRVVVIRDVAALKKDALRVLDSYLEHPPMSTVLVLVATAGTTSDAILVERCEFVEFKLLTENELARWISQYAETLGATIESRAAELLCRSTGNDLALLAGEISKLRSYVTGSVIDDRAVTAIVGVRRGETMGDLLDLVARRAGTQAVALLGRTLSQPKISAVTIVMALSAQTLAIGWAIAARNQGVQQYQLERELYTFLKEAPSTYVGRPWGDAVKAWVRSMSRWDSSAIDRALELLAAADSALKDTRVSSEEQLLASLMLALAAEDPRRAAA